MKLTLAAILGSFALTSAKLGKGNRRLVAENAGAFHTDAFEQLSKKYQNKLPETQLDMMMDISEIVGSYCPEENSACRSEAFQATLDRFSKHEQKQRTDGIPSNMDPKVKKSLRKIYSIINKLDETNVDVVVEELGKVQNKISKMKNVNPTDQMVAIAAASIAQESATFWNDAYNDKNHPLSPILSEVHDSKRMLQVSGNLTWEMFLPLNRSAIVDADTKGAVEYSITAVNSTPNLVFNFAELLLKLIAGAIPASAAIALTIQS